MSRTLSSIAIAAAQSPETGVVFHILMRITHPTLPDAIRICDNNEQVTSRGDVYLPVAFNLALPDDTDQALPTMSISIDNVNQALVDMIRELTSPPSFIFEMVTSVQPDILEIGIYDLIMRSVTWNDYQMTIELSNDDVLNQSWPDSTFNPSEFAGAFS